MKRCCCNNCNILILKTSTLTLLYCNYKCVMKYFSSFYMPVGYNLPPPKEKWSGETNIKRLAKFKAVRKCRNTITIMYLLIIISPSTLGPIAIGWAQMRHSTSCFVLYQILQ